LVINTVYSHRMSVTNKDWLMLFIEIITVIV